MFFFVFFIVCMRFVTISSRVLMLDNYAEQNISALAAFDFGVQSCYVFCSHTVVSSRII